MLRQHLVVGAAFDDAALIEHANLVGVENGRPSVGNNQRGAVFRYSIEFGPDCPFRLKIQRRGGFIENQDWRIHQDRRCQSDALFFTVVNHHAGFTDGSLVLLR